MFLTINFFNTDIVLTLKYLIIIFLTINALPLKFFNSKFLTKPFIYGKFDFLERKNFKVKNVILTEPCLVPYAIFPGPYFFTRFF